MGNRTRKRKQRYVECMKDRSKLRSLIHGNIHFSEQCKVLNDFGTMYASRRSFI